MPTCSNRSTRLADDGPDGARALAVARHVGLDEDRLRAAPVGLGCAHRRADAEAARFVAGRGHDAAPARIAADDDRLAAAAPAGRAARRRRRMRRGRGGRSRPARAHGRRARRHRLAAAEDGAYRGVRRQPDGQLRRARPCASAARARRAARWRRAAARARSARPARACDAVTTTPIGAPAGESGGGAHEAADAQRGRALHRAHVGELQSRGVGARDRQRHAPAAQSGDGHAHGRASVLPAIAAAEDRPPALSADARTQPARCRGSRR